MHKRQLHRLFWSRITIKLKPWRERNIETIVYQEGVDQIIETIKAYLIWSSSYFCIPIFLITYNFFSDYPQQRNRQNSSSHLLNNICDEIRYERKLRTKLKDEEVSLDLNCSKIMNNGQAKTAAAAFSSISYNTPSDERFVNVYATSGPIKIRAGRA